MRATEFITEAHHSILAVMKLGPWRVQIDSHALASAANRGVDTADFTNIINYAAQIPNTLSTIPIGKGAYFQDINTMISIYVHRISQDEIRVETVLGPDMSPKPPMFRRPVPKHNLKPIPGEKQAREWWGQQTQQHGRDHVSQELANRNSIRNSIMNTMNRADRREFIRRAKKIK